MIKTKVKMVYYSSRANRHFMSKYSCAKNEAKFWIMAKYPTEEGCAHFSCGYGGANCGDEGFYAPSDLDNYEQIHRRLYKRILKNIEK